MEPGWRRLTDTPLFLLLATQLLAFFTGATVVVAAQAAPSHEVTLSDYLRLVAQYRAGDFIEAKLALAGWPGRSVEQLVDQLDLHSLSDAEIKACALLHTEAGLYRQSGVDLHLEIARELQQGISAPEKRRPFLRMWYLAVGEHFRSQVDEVRSLLYLGAARDEFPGDGEILLALGSTAESFSILNKNRARLKQAHKYYREALRADEENLEIHLRLGRVLDQLEQQREATSELTEILENTTDPYLLYMANLFLGSLNAKESQWTKAIRFYQAAAEADLNNQVAYLALSLALHRSGDRSEARAYVERMLSRRVPSGYEDGWWRYVVGERDAFYRILRLMREEVRQ
jgi:tetratricopeptide (TPR) repeat protein